MNAEEKDANERGLLDLEKCTNELRGSKYHVLLDDIRLDIWVFSFSEHERSATEALIPAKRISEITEQYGFISEYRNSPYLPSILTLSLRGKRGPFGVVQQRHSVYAIVYHTTQGTNCAILRAETQGDRCAKTAL